MSQTIRSCKGGKTQECDSTANREGTAPLDEVVPLEYPATGTYAPDVVLPDDRGRSIAQSWSRAGCIWLCRKWPLLCVVLERWRRTAFRFDPEVVELQTGVMALVIGLWLLILPNEWGHRSSNFHLMLLEQWPAWVWAIMFLCVGCAQMVALNRAWIKMRCVCAMSAFCLWAFVAILIALEGLPGPATFLFPVIALSQAWVYLRLRTRCDSFPCDSNYVNPNHGQDVPAQKAPPPRT